MSRALSRREKVLVAILAVLLVALVYYLLVYQPVQKELSSARLKEQDVESSIMLEQAKTIRLDQMRGQLETLRQGDDVELAPMAEYDNAQNVMAELASILSAATDYDLSFSPVVIDGNLVRRSIGMNFGCAGYADARNILEQFYACRYRCSIGDFSITAKLPIGTDAEPDLLSDNIRVNLTVTFFELTKQ